MRLLVALDNWGLIGGSERYAGEIVASLAARGHAVTVLAGAERAPPLTLPRGALLLVEPAYSDGAATHGALADLARRARAARPDVVYVLTCFQARTFAALANVAPVVRFVQDHTLFCPSLNKIEGGGSNCTRPLGVACLERYFLTEGCSCFRRAGRVRPWVEGVGEFKKKLAEFDRAKSVRRLVVASEYMKRELVAAGDAPDHVAVIPYFVREAPAPRELRGPAARSDARSCEAPLVLAPARLVLPDKGLDVLLAALARVRVPFRAVIAGDGPARAWLVAKARAEGLEGQVAFPGWRSAAELAALYAEARAVAFPSTWQEPFGLVGIEAGAHGVPVVAFDVGGVGEWLLHERTGFLHARGDVEALARSLERLCADPELAARLGAAGRERVRRDFTEALHVERLERVLAEAAGA